MKKVMLLLSVVLMALCMVGCQNPVSGGEEQGITNLYDGTPGSWKLSENGEGWDYDFIITINSDGTYKEIANVRTVPPNDQGITVGDNQLLHTGTAKYSSFDNSIKFTVSEVYKASPYKKNTDFFATVTGNQLILQKENIVYTKI